MLLPKNPPLRDRRYLDWLRTQPCIITGLLGSDTMAVDPAHLGTYGRGMKSPDNEALPILHNIHLSMHQEGEASVLRSELPNDVLMEAMRLYARRMHEQWEG